MADHSENTCDGMAHAVATTQFTETGTALFRLLCYGMISPTDARHLVEGGLAEPDWINVEFGTPKPEVFHLIALTVEGKAAAEHVKQRMAPLPGLCGAQQIEGDTFDSDRPGVMTRNTFWERLSAMKASVAKDWRPGDQPDIPSQSHPYDTNRRIVDRNQPKGKPLRFVIDPEIAALFEEDASDPDQTPEDT
jgi:hypothetical protein